MSINTLDTRRLGHADHPSNPERRIRANFARQATIDAFGWRFAKALDQMEVDFPKAPDLADVAL